MHLWAFARRRAKVAEQTKTLLRKSIQFHTPAVQPSPKAQVRLDARDFGPDCCARQAPPAPGLLPAAHLLGRPSMATGGAAGRLRPKRRQ